MRKKKQSKANHVDVKDLFADHAWWLELNKYLPWTLIGFTNRFSANFNTDAAANDFITLNGDQRGQLIKAFEKFQTKQEFEKVFTQE